MRRKPVILIESNHNTIKEAYSILTKEKTDFRAVDLLEFNQTDFFKLGIELSHGSYDTIVIQAGLLIPSFNPFYTADRQHYIDAVSDLVHCLNAAVAFRKEPLKVRLFYSSGEVAMSSDEIKRHLLNLEAFRSFRYFTNQLLNNPLLNL